MNNKTAILSNTATFLRWWVLPVMCLCLMVLSYSQMALAQNGPDGVNKGSSNNKVLQKPNLKQYLVDKYGIDDVMSSVYQTPNGPKGHLGTFGKISPEPLRMNMKEIPGEHGRAKAIAKAFMVEEADLLGINDMNEFHESVVKMTIANIDYTGLIYNRFIDDLPLKNARIHFDVGPNDTITGVSADLVPAPPELYAAVKKETLTEDQARKIVQRDLKSAKIAFNPSNMGEFKKFAIPDPPYVIWEVRDVYIYTIDAFTGEILKKVPNWKTLRAPR